MSLYRTSSKSKSTKRILPSNYVDSNEGALVPRHRAVPLTRWYITQNVVDMIRSLFSVVSFSSLVPSCKSLGDPRGMLVSPGLGRKVTGTLYGYKKGFVNFAIQEDPRSEPVLLLELAMSTCTMVKEMASGLVRIALECESGSGKKKLLQEPVWTMYCNGRKCGQTVSRNCVESDWYLLSVVQNVSAGAGVVPCKRGLSNNGTEGDLMYMRGRFERVVGNRNSEAYYLMNPDGNGGPELSVFLLRI